jgi:hypothetical protein
MSEQRSTHRFRTPAAPPLGTRRTAAIAAGLLGCALVLAAVVAGVRTRIGSPPGEHAPSATLGYTVAVILGVLYGVGLFSYFSARLKTDEDEAPAEEPATLFQRILVWITVTAAAVLPIVAVLLWRSRSGNRRTAPLGGGPGSGAGAHAVSRAPIQLHWPYLAAAAAAAVLAVVALAVFLRHGSRGTGELSERAVLADAVTAGIDELEDDPDPRRAVIRAYGAMEGSLGAHGLPRRDAETPFEYLSRIFTGEEAGAPAAARLTPLYEQARFSTHEIDEGMRDRAIAALRDLRAELEG